MILLALAVLLAGGWLLLYVERAVEPYNVKTNLMAGLSVVVALSAVAFVVSL